MKKTLPPTVPMPESSVDSRKRQTLKIIGGSAALAGSVAATIVPQGVSAAMSDARSKSAVKPAASNGYNNGLISINVMVSKSVSYDWILIENLSDNPVEVTRFTPGVIAYMGKRIDLNRLLSADKATGPLLLHTDYAWSESLYGLQEKQGQMPGGQLRADSALESISADTRVIKAWANVVESKAEVFLGDYPKALA